MKSPSDFIESSSTEHSREQFETLTEQTKELTALAQKVMLSTAEPLKTGVTKAFSQLRPQRDIERGMKYGTQ